MEGTRISLLFSVAFFALLSIGIANAATSIPIVPSNVQEYITITLTYNGLANYPNPFQQMITINALNYTPYMSFNGNFANFEYFYANGTIIPAWIESNSSNIITTWVKLSNTIFPNTGSSSATNTIYLGFANKTTNLLSSSGTSGIGEAPQLSCPNPANTIGCSTYAEYDDGASVFNFYDNFAGTTLNSKWINNGESVSVNNGVTLTPSGSAGTWSRDSITYNTNVYNTDYIAESFTKITALGADINPIMILNSNSATAYSGNYNLVDGGIDLSGTTPSYYHDTQTSSGSVTSTSISMPSGYSYSAFNIYQIYVNGASVGVAVDYSNIINTQTNYNPSTQYLGIGSWKRVYTPTSVTQWFRTRAYPPNGVMPSVSFTSVQAAPGYPLLTITTNPIIYGSNTLVYVNTNTAANTAGNTIELLINGNVVAGPTTSNITYIFNSLQAGYGAGSYTFNAYDENTLKSATGTLIVNKATPIISLPNFPQPFIYNGISVPITASISSINNQLIGNIYINNTFLESFTTSNSFTETNPNNYTVVANTIGNANYTAASVSNTLIICPQVSPLPSSIVAYSCIILNNSQATATSNPFQQLVNISEASFSNYLAYNNNSANFEFFYQNRTIIPAWIESNSSGTLHVWLKIKNIPASKHILVYLGFANKTTNLLSNSGIIGIGEAPQLSCPNPANTIDCSTYAEYDDGASVFNFYDNFAGTSIGSIWTIVVPSGTTITQNNEIAISTSYSSYYGGLILTEGFTGTQIFEGDITAVSYLSGGLALQTGNSASSNSLMFLNWSGSVAYGSMSGVTIGNKNPNLQISTGIMGGAWLSSSSQVWYKNYVASLGSQTVYKLPSTIYPSIGVYFSTVPSSITFQWVRTRAYPPNGVMPSVSFTSVHVISGYPILTITPDPIAYGNSALIHVSTNKSFDTAGNTIELIMNGNVVIGPTTSNITYAFNSLQYGAGSYTFNAFDGNTLNSEIGTLIVNKNSTYPFNLSLMPSQNYVCNGTGIKATFSLSSFKNQLIGTLYLNGNLIDSTTTSGIYTSSASDGTYIFTFNTVGDANYTSASITKEVNISSLAFSTNGVYGDANPESVALPSGYKLYICAAGANSTFATSSPAFSWTANVLAPLNATALDSSNASVGIQTSNICSAYTTGASFPGLAVAGIGLNQTRYVLFTNASGSSTSASLSYTVATPSSFVVLAGAAGSYNFTTISLPSGCSMQVRKDNIDGDETAFIATCQNVASGSYTLSASLNGSGSAALAAYVFPPYNVILTDNPTNATITTNGDTYANSSIIQMIGANTITANPPTTGSWVFNSWIVSNSLNLSIANTLASSTSLTVMGSGTVTATWDSVTASSSGNPGSAYYSYPVTITFKGTPMIHHQAKWSLYVNGALYGTTNSTITYYEQFAPPGRYNFVFNLTNANYTLYTYTTSLVISYQPTGAHFVSTTVTTSTTTSTTTSIPTTSLTTTIPPSQKAISITANISSSSPLVLSLPNTHSTLSIYTTSAASTPIAAHIANVTQQVSSFAKPQPNYTLINAVNVSIKTIAPATAFFVEKYPCSIPSDLVAPYIFKNNTWFAITNYTVNATTCTISFYIPSDPIVAIFEKNISTTTTTSIATTIPTTIPTTTPTTIYYPPPSPKPSSPLVAEALILIIILIIIILVLFYYYKLLHRRYHGFKR